MLAAWAWPLGIIIAVVLIFVVIFRLSSDIERDEQKADGEKWWGGGE